MVGNEDIVIMIMDTSMVGNDMEWWIDSGATKHIAKNKAMFKAYEPIKDSQ